MSHLENLERKLREMSENGATSHEITGENSNAPNTINTTGNVEGFCDLRIPRRFVRVLGYEGRFNDLVYCKPLLPTTSEDEELHVDSESNTISNTGEDGRQKCLVYFGGDMQDFPEIMEQHKEHRGYLRYNLEATAGLLQKQFPGHHIVVIRPSRIQIMTFSCFDNFVNSATNTGVPDHVITHGSLQHLELLLRNLSDRVEKSQRQDKLLAKQIAIVVKDEEGEAEVSSTTTDEEKNIHPHLDRAKISLVGFSKGCVVLNQMLYEFHYLKTLTPDDSTMSPFVSCIEDMYWLDGGHNGGKNTWITSRSLIETLSRQNIRVHVHMTPYQLTDERRPWIRKEERVFSDLMTRFSSTFKRYVHFVNERASLPQHFRLLEEVGDAEKTMERVDPEGSSNNEDSHVDTESTDSDYTSVLSSV